MPHGQSMDAISTLQSRIAKLEMNQKIQRMAQDQKMELMKMQAALENEKRDRLLENERRDRQAENRDRLLEQKMEQIKMQAALEKKDLAHALENEKRDRLQQIEIEMERRDRQAEKKGGALQTQIQQMKWKLRFGQMEQQLAARSIMSIPAQPITTNHAQQGETALLLQHILELKSQEKERNSHSHVSSPASAPPQHHTAARAALLLSPQVSVNTAILPVAAEQQASHKSKKQKQPGLIPAQSEYNKSSDTIQEKPHHAQRQISNTNRPVNGRTAVPLPRNARLHFFLSHCQATGGDQTNAIYLELRQLGFSCW
jgi:hypothetical protein